MKPRRDRQSPAVPERLARYVPSEWKGEPDPALAWYRACMNYIATHGYDTPIGDPVSVIRAYREVKIREAS